MSRRKNRQQKKHEKEGRRKRHRCKRTVPPSGGNQGQQFTVNKRFNRLESELDHFYCFNYGTEPPGDECKEGLVKCRLLHGMGCSLIVPDQIFLGADGSKWIQPLAFMANIIAKSSEDEIVCDLPVDISCGQTLRIRFYNHGLLANLDDGSQLYKCEIQGPSDLAEHATGDSCLGPEGVPYIRLYHHTTPVARDSIASSGHFRTSMWNIQGTRKKLVNVAYAYFTPLNQITCDNDLKMIAMATGGEIELRRDGFTPPEILLPDWRETFKDDVLVMPVYPCNPSKREATLELWVDSTVLALQHIYRHDEGGPVYYEFPHPFIHRIGTEPGASVTFDDQGRIHRQPYLKAFEYGVVGDCTTLEGLAAPYDEEDTTDIMKVERMDAGMSILNFWFDHGNQDLFSKKQVDLQEFEK
ncbi:MAG: hypothetical protein CMJ19_04990 [Phycisphaeraceae bacterium]|nr:hypothetical protein [Phycisphaeraceae bacterium]